MFPKPIPGALGSRETLIPLLLYLPREERAPLTLKCQVALGSSLARLGQA